MCRTRWTSIALLVVTALAGGCGSTFVVTAPEAMQVDSQEFSETANGMIQIEITFSDPVEIGSIQPRINLQLQTEQDANAPISVAGDPDDDRVVLVTSEDPMSDLCGPATDCFFSLVILGSGSTPVTNSDGDALDGDNDDTAGGDYSTTFVAIG